MNKRKKFIINDEPVVISINDNLSGLLITKGGYKLEERYFGDEDMKLIDIPSAFVMLISNKEEVRDIEKKLQKIIDEENKKEVEKLKRDFEVYFGFSFDNIFAYGKTSFDYKSIGKIIPRAILHHKSIDGEELFVSCKCYSKNEWKKLTISNVIPHEDSHTSWNCFMAIAGNPEYGIILKEYNN